MKPSRPTRLRCAIYTRKSSDDGLDQAFNSLDAQREACEAYILSQAGENWQLIKTRYDDGGLSGGTLDRPALQRLLADIQERKVDTVVVYKVDRLTRSLSDFAKIVEIFDAQGASFVSVTQQFNTTNSMGRLTLNMLLSFAQFEREVTGERIRDKIAASKRKGMWMGGYVPLGYDANGRTLAINVAEAESIRMLYRLYLRVGNVRLVKQEADRLKIVTKRRLRTSGIETGGYPLSRGHIYKLLSNALYLGQIVHKGAAHTGQHPAIIDDDTWNAVQAKLSENAGSRRSGAGANSPSLLTGLLFDQNGRRLTPSHAVKSGRRYRYYVTATAGPGTESKVTDTMRIPAHQIEDLVLGAARQFFTDKVQIIDRLELGDLEPQSLPTIIDRAQTLAASLKSGNTAACRIKLKDLLHRIVIASERIEISVSLTGAKRTLGVRHALPNDDTRADSYHCIFVPTVLKRSGLAMKLVIGDVKLRKEVAKADPVLVKTLRRAHYLFGRLTSGEVRSVDEIAVAEGISQSYVVRILRLAFLAPDITQTILQGRQPAHLTAEGLIKLSRLPLEWERQREVLGFGSTT